MSYIGNFSILDRGDAPAQAVIERNARSLAERVVAETREELNKVMSRVHTIYGTMETVENVYSNPTMEYLTDLAELEELLKDEIKKRQYHQQVTVFIVGYQDVCHQKLRLMQQVNEFFMENSKSMDEEEWFPTTPDMDLDEMSSTLEDSLNHAHELTNRLAELNKEMMDYMLALAEKKANSRGRKKIEKSLQQAKDEVNSLKEKLLILQNELQEREDKVQNLFKQLDIKSLDVQKFRTAAELGKQKLIMVQKELDDQKKSHEETKTNLMKLLDNQIRALHESHRQEMDELKGMYEAKQLQESSPPGKAAKVPGKTSVTSSRQQVSKSPVRSKAESKISNRTKSEKEGVESLTQDDRVEPAAGHDKSQFQTTRPKHQSKNIPASVLESNYDQTFDLFDEEAWADVPDEQLRGRFAQYRQLSTKRLKELEELMQLTTAKTRRKVASLKAQFHEHKSKWEAERILLIEQVDQSLKFQSDAEKEADTAMTHLEDFITEQERLEQNEEVRSNEQFQASPSIAHTDSQTPGHGLAEQTNTSRTPNQSGVSAVIPESEQDIQKLMKQTDDAKVQEINARLGMCASGPPAVEMEPSTLQNTESGSSEEIKSEGKKEEEFRSQSTQSRASLREHYKAKLEEAKLAAESRRSKSPAISLPAQLTLVDELLLDDEDDDDKFEDDVDFTDAMTDPSMHDVGTSPPSGLRRSSRGHASFSRDPSQLTKSSRSSTDLLEQPLLREYIRAYDGILTFKAGMGKIFLDKDLMSAYQMITDLETLTFDHSKKTLPQVEELTKNILYVLEELRSIINNHIVYDREPAVSSLNIHSREPTEKSPSDSLMERIIAPHGSKEATDSVTTSHISGVRNQKSSNAADTLLIQDLQDQYNVLKQQLSEDGRTHQEQLQRSKVVINEMQNTICELQQELSTLCKTGDQSKTGLSGDQDEKSPSPETSVMFTRLDSERNAKIMKRAVMEEKLDPEKYKEAVSKMDEYVSLPAKRLSNLVKKYVHHKRMKEIDEKVRTSSNMTEEVLHVFDKMESLQNQRTRLWAERMHGMGMERLKLANLLMDTLDTIEQESGIFLIKPMYSYRGRDIKPDHVCKLSRPVRHRHRRMTPYTEAASSFIPAPTPNSNYRPAKHDEDLSRQHNAPSITMETCPTEMRLEQDSEQPQVVGSSLAFSTESPETAWNMQTSIPLRDQPVASCNTPKILELDVKRMLIGQNNISTKLPFQRTDDRLMNANQNTLRSYVTVQRPTAYLGTDRPTSGSGKITYTTAQKVGISKVDKDLPNSFPSPQPLPPITPTQGDEMKEREVVKSTSVSSSYKDSNDLRRKSTGVFHVPV